MAALSSLVSNAHLFPAAAITSNATKPMLAFADIEWNNKTAIHAGKRRAYPV
jgi:hypothetical protein